jgi:molybdopterin-guanine dinucleotide biosynthesis protein A
VIVLAGVVLCGGHSVRFGTDKALWMVRGEPLVIRVARRLSSVADPVLLAPGTPGRLRSTMGWPQVADERPESESDAGPLGGLAGALAASPHDLLAAVAVDMPFASPALFRLLAELRQDEDAVVPRTGAGPEPLHAVYATSALPAIRRALAEGRFALRSMLDRLSVRVVDEDEWRPADPEGRFAINLNRMEDAAALE